MSPERQSPRRASNASSKPYSRDSTPNNTVNIQSTHVAPPEDYQLQGVPMDKLGFPTYASYKEIETTYVTSLHPRRQAKALISQHMFDRIWDVLHDDEDGTINAQFRFWARKTFTLGKLPKVVKLEPGAPPPQTVILHQGSIVAIREQIYDILCFSHAAVNHGGRDKTCTAVRENYAWIPKELVANFVKACPTCIEKKLGASKSNQTKEAIITRRKTFPALREYLSDLVHHVGLNSGHDKDDKSPLRYSLGGSSASMTALDVDTGSKSDASELFGAPIPDDNASSSSVSSLSNPLDQQSGSATESFDLTPPAAVLLDREANQSAPARLLDSQAPVPILNDNILNRQANLSTPARPVISRTHKSCSGLQSLPMSREVSLFQGLPNGWQFQHADYAAAREDFVVKKCGDSEQGSKSAPSSQLSTRSGGCGRPRIPSVAPMVPAEFVDDESKEDMDVPSLHKENKSTLKPPAAGMPAGHGLDLSSDPFLFGKGAGPCAIASEIQEAPLTENNKSSEAISSPAYHTKKLGPSIISPVAAPLSLDMGSLVQAAVDTRLAHRSTSEDLSPDESVGSPARSVASFVSRQVSPSACSSNNRDEALEEALADTTDALKLSMSLEAVCEGEGVVGIGVAV